MYTPNKDDSLYAELHLLNPEKYPYTPEELEAKEEIRYRCYKQFLKIKAITEILFKGELKWKQVISRIKYELAEWQL